MPRPSTEIPASGAAVPANRRRDPLTRAFQVLRRLAESNEGARGVRDLAAELDWPPSTVHRVLRALEQDGIVSVDPDGHYKLGLQFLKLAYRATNGYPVWDSAIPALRELVAECHETALLGIYDRRRREMTFAAAVESDHPVRYVADLRREWYPIHSGASGLAIFSFLPEGERAEVIRTSGLPMLTPATITDPKALETEARKIRKRGYAVSRGERIQGAAAVAAPVWDSDHRVLGDVFVTVPLDRFQQTDEHGLASAVVSCAKVITARLSGGIHGPL
jgi:IclR family acetate operon transcriptional repressor